MLILIVNHFYPFAKISTTSVKITAFISIITDKVIPKHFYL